MWRKIAFLLILIICCLPALADNKIDSLKIALKKAIADTAKVQCYNYLSKAYRVDNPSLAIEYAVKAEKISLGIAYNVGVALALNNKGFAQFFNADFEKAFSTFSRCLKFSRQTANVSAAGNALMGMGLVRMYQGEYEKSVKYFYKTLLALEHLNDHEGLAKIYNNIGEVYRYIGNYSLALKYLNLSLEKEILLNNQEGITESYSNIGNIHFSHNQFDKALEYYQLAISRKDSGIDVRNYATMMNNVGAIYGKNAEYDKALERFQEALGLYVSIGDKIGEAKALENIGTIELFIGNYSNAENRFLKVIKLGAEVGSKSQQILGYDGLTRLYEKVKDNKKAFESLQILKLLSDSLYNEKVLGEVSQIETNYKIVRKEKEIAVLNKEKAELQLIEQRAKEFRNYSYIAVGIVLAMGGAAFKRYRNKIKANERLEIAVAERTILLESQKKEMELMLKEIHHRVKNNLQLVSSLLNLELSYKPGISAEELAERCKEKIRCMAIIHDRLYKAEDFSKLNVNSYFSELAIVIARMSGANDIVKVELSEEALFLSLDVMIPCGLILNELVSNAFKHNNGLKEVKISFRKIDNHYELIVKDDGRGLPEGMDFKKLDSLGLSLVYDLANQIDGKITFENDNGLKAKLIF
jgi:two-component system, sensor histidine kinase PdtaS